MTENPPEGDIAHNVSFSVTSSDDYETQSTSVLRSLKEKADRFRHYLSTRCCACIASVPSFALVILAVVMVMLLISSIPLAFALAYMSPAQTDMGAKNKSIHPIRSGGGFPDNSTIRSDPYAIPHLNDLLPPNVISARGYGFACTNEPGVSIGLHQRCDGMKDCKDGSDELGCKECVTSLSCPADKLGSGRLKCLRGDQLCDGVIQCADGSDEDETYCRRNCTSNEFRCTSEAKCLPMEMRCDGDPQCKDESDEEDCRACTNGAKLCKETKRCIPKWKLCDGHLDCPDGSDEKDCTNKTCSGTGKVLCKGKDSMCLLRKKVCDGIDDCPGGEDEQKCPGACMLDKNANAEVRALNKEVKCKDSILYPWQVACGGLQGACELSCEKCNNETSIKCKSDSSASGIKCVHRSKICDGRQDCDDGADEASCDCSAPGMKKCKSRGPLGQTICYSQAQRCDGFADCPGGEDEANCDSCKGNAFHCVKDKKCIQGGQRCDGRSDCFDDSDEMNCTCDECSKQPVKMYMCSSGDRCFPVTDVCMPYSLCPNASKRDTLFCASRTEGPTL